MFSANESVNSNRPEFLPTVRYRQSTRQRSRLTICSACSHPSSGVVERKAKRGRGLGRLVSQEGMELDTVVSDRNSKRSAVMRVCTTGEGNGSDLGAGGSGNEASGGEMEYDGRVAGIGVSAGKEGDMGRSGQIGGGGKRGVLM